MSFTPAAGMGNGPFEIYKGTQAQMLTSDVVLVAALRKPEVAKLSIVQDEDDPVRWLAKNVKVELPLNTEIMKVSLSDTRKNEVAVLVRAVVDAYMNEVVDAELHAQRDRLTDLDRLYTEKETEMRDPADRAQAVDRATWNRRYGHLGPEAANYPAGLRRIEKPAFPAACRIAAGQGRPANQASLAQEPCKPPQNWPRTRALQPRAIQYWGGCTIKSRNSTAAWRPIARRSRSRCFRGSPRNIRG